MFRNQLSCFASLCIFIFSLEQLFIATQAANALKDVVVSMSRRAIRTEINNDLPTTSNGLQNPKVLRALNTTNPKSVYTYLQYLRRQNNTSNLKQIQQALRKKTPQQLRSLSRDVVQHPKWRKFLKSNELIPTRKQHFYKRKIPKPFNKFKGETGKVSDSHMVARSPILASLLGSLGGGGGLGGALGGLGGLGGGLGGLGGGLGGLGGLGGGGGGLGGLAGALGGLGGLGGGGGGLGGLAGALGGLGGLGGGLGGLGGGLGGLGGGGALGGLGGLGGGTLEGLGGILGSGGLESLTRGGRNSGLLQTVALLKAIFESGRRGVDYDYDYEDEEYDEDYYYDYASKTKHKKKL